MVIKVYISNLSGNMTMKKKQQRIIDVLASRKIEYETHDISACEQTKERMRELCNQPKALAPQIFNDDEYCGDFEALDEALEVEELYEFLKMAPPKERSAAKLELNTSENGQCKD